jgi:hypothetical protein
MAVFGSVWQGCHALNNNVLTRRHCPLSKGDSSGLGVGFKFSSCCTTARYKAGSQAQQIKCWLENNLLLPLQMLLPLMPHAELMHTLPCCFLG